MFELAHIRYLYGFFNKGNAVVRLMFRTAVDSCCIAMHSFLCGGIEKGFATYNIVSEQAPKIKVHVQSTRFYHIHDIQEIKITSMKDYPATLSSKDIAKGALRTIE